jgi:putative oxidoreductase
MNEGLLIVRVVVGLLMAAHGAQKAFGWFHGYGLRGTGGYMESLGFRPGRVFAAAAAYSELAGGLLLALGLLGPTGPALILSVMIVAAVTVHWHGVFAQSNGVEVPLLYAAIAVGLAFTGPGRYSVDALLGLDVLTAPLIAIGALVAGIAGALGNLALRRPVAAEPAMARKAASRHRERGWRTSALLAGIASGHEHTGGAAGCTAAGTALSEADARADAAHRGPRCTPQHRSG